MSNISYPKYKLEQDISINSVTASSGFTGSFYGDGSGLTNLPPDAYTTQVSGNITGSGIVTDKIRLKDDISLNSVTASVGITSSFYGDGAGLYNIPTGAINDINQFATLTGVSGTFVSGTQLTTILNDYATLTGVSGTFVSQSQLANYATLIGVSSSFIPKNIMIANFTSSDADLPNVQVSMIGGTPPYTYEWSLAQGNYNNKIILPPFNSSSVVLINNFENNSYTVTDSTMLKLIVTDSNNVTNTFYHNHSVVGYSPMTLNIGRIVDTGSCSNGNMLSASLPMFDINFMDINFTNDVYESLTKCSDPIKEKNFEIDYRSLRDAKYFNLNQKINLDDHNHLNTLHTNTLTIRSPTGDETTCDITQFNNYMNQQILDSLNSGSNTIFKQFQQIRKFNYLLGLDLHKYNKTWNAKILNLSKDWSISGSIYYSDLTGTIRDHYIGYSTMQSFGIINLPSVESVENLPVNGMPGQIIQVTADANTYAWSPLYNQWNIALATRINELELRSVKDCIGDVQIKYKTIEDVLELPPTGGPGDVYAIGPNLYSDHYAWNNIESKWDIFLGYDINNLNITRQARIFANIRSIFEFILSLSPFVDASFNFPFHKIR